jgi:NAD+ synthase (glutamine-hydrolysing)
MAVGDIDRNAERIVEAIREATDEGAQVVAVPELALTGYPPEDLLLKESFVASNLRALERVASSTGDLLAIVGFVEAGRSALYNAAAICHRGGVVEIYRKHRLPNYGVFDEQRYFDPGRGHVLIDTPDGVLGVCVCEDIWSERGPAISQGDAGAQIVININASPFHKNKLAERTGMLAERARRARASIVYVNLVGGQDEVVFDGGSLVIDPSGHTVARAPQFHESLEVVDVPLGEAGSIDDPSVRRIELHLRAPGHKDYRDHPVHDALGPEAEIYEALRLALKDYVKKNRFSKVVVGLSGGIDSSLVATIASDALGPARVLSVAMPSEFSSSHSIEDAKALAASLGIEMLEISIVPIHRAYLQTMTNALGAAEPGITEENLQARIRGNLLMAISNRYGHLVVTTGNKSEMACGYATLYGDMAGGFALLRDVFKTEVYALAHYRNSLSHVIPENVLHKAPSAELRQDQRDSDSLPPYDVLDSILEAYIEQDASIKEMTGHGAERDLVEKVITMVDRAEYKRRQAPPGPKVTTKAFGRDRRLPITNRWRQEPSVELPAREVGERGPS